MERLTEKSTGCFGYSLKEYKFKAEEFSNYDAFCSYNSTVKRLGELEDMLEPKPIEEWNEDFGNCLWWSFPIEEPPYCGSPLDVDFPSEVTHFTRLIEPLEAIKKRL